MYLPLGVLKLCLFRRGWTKSFTLHCQVLPSMTARWLICTYRFALVHQEQFARLDTERAGTQAASAMAGADEFGSSCKRFGLRMSLQWRFFFKFFSANLLDHAGGNKNPRLSQHLMVNREP